MENTIGKNKIKANRIINSVSKCSVCGKKFDMFDDQQCFRIHKRSIGYGSKYDGMSLDMMICCDCMDNLIDACSVSPLKEKEDK